MTASLHRPDGLPDFGDPPLVETALSLQFESLQAFSLVHVGMLWNEFRTSFPRVEEHPPLGGARETFRVPSPASVGVTIERKPPLPRVWFLNESRSQLIQVQEDRFIHNWRKEGNASTAHPRYERIRESYLGEVRKFEEFLNNEQIGQVVVNQCEVIYVNHIEPCQVWHKHAELEKIIRSWTARSHSFLPEAESGSVEQKFVMKSESGVPLGRLHASLTPAWKAEDQSPILVLTLIARGSPLFDGIDGAFAFFDLGRRWIVKGFTDLTTTEMHRVWRRIDA